jgi:hypothetical protein
MTRGTAEMVKQGNRCRRELMRAAPSLHLNLVDHKTEVYPIWGTDRQSEEHCINISSSDSREILLHLGPAQFVKTLNELEREGSVLTS